ncbi:MAG: alkaline phosphatase family protein [Williamsia sp.]|nr:alkaline phosphatase family protein [Williamsia sp.]
MKKTVVIDVVGLSTSVIGAHTPFLQKWISQKKLTRIEPVFPAVTTSVQSTYLTGKTPAAHGVVGNGWYDREDCEIKFWKQSNKLVQAEKIWDKAKKIDPSFTCANMFWWYNMYSSVDYSLTPRPNYLADGRKMPDCYSHPASLRDEAQQTLGQFPLFQFWGPGANIKSSRWIADASILTDKKWDPTLTFIYLPHLDYCLQKYGPDPAKISKDLQEIDGEISKLVTHYESKQANIIILSEYGISPVSYPIHINRILRQHNLIAIREERGLELLDAGASKAFAVADHQVAHIYINDPTVLSQVKDIVKGIPGVELVLDEKTKAAYGIDHRRAGELVLMAGEGYWFTYYHWLDDAVAPDFARTVEIFKKPGYDPVEMFMSSKARAGYKLLRKKAGLRYVMDVIPLDANLIKGSHGRVGVDEAYMPVLISNNEPASSIKPERVFDIIWDQLNG